MLKRSRSIALCLGLSLGLGGCASGPHPSLEVASKSLGCPVKDLTRHEIYPDKQRIEGCGKEAIFVRGCTEYGASGECRWAKYNPTR